MSVRECFFCPDRSYSGVRGVFFCVRHFSANVPSSARRVRSKYVMCRSSSSFFIIEWECWWWCKRTHFIADGLLYILVYTIRFEATAWKVGPRDFLKGHKRHAGGRLNMWDRGWGNGCMAECTWHIFIISMRKICFFLLINLVLLGEWRKQLAHSMSGFERT